MTFISHRSSRPRPRRGSPRRRTLAVQSLEARRLLASDVMGGAGPLAPFVTDGETAQISTWTAVGSEPGAEQLPVRDDVRRSGEGEAPHSVHFRFVYPADADPSGFFGKFPQAKTLLEQAGRQLTDRLADQLAAINPLPAGVTWVPQYNNPATGTSKAVPAGLKIGANEIIVFVGSRNLQSLDPPGSTALTRAYVKGMDASSFSCAAVDSPTCTALVQKHLARGQTLMQGNKAVDFAPALGSLTFDTRSSTMNDLFFEQGTMQPDQVRFLTLAQHELAHLLGVGIAPSYFSNFSGNHFAGKHAKAIYGGPVPLAPPDGGHLHPSVTDAGWSIMGPYIHSSSLFQELDFAVLRDIGWEVVADTRPIANLDTPDLVVVENAGTIEITATLSQPSPTKITLPVTLRGTAATTSDVRLSSPNFVFQANQRSAKIIVTIVDDDADEATETVTISLSENASVRLGSQTDFHLTIFDDDGVLLSKVPRITPASISDSIDIPGDNQPYGIVFRAAANRTLSITAKHAAPISEAVLLIDIDQNVIGSYAPDGLARAALIAGQSYAVVFYPRATPRTFAVSLPGGFAAATPRTNVLLRPDVNGKDGVTAVDALQIINQLNLANNDSSIDAATVSGDGFYDVSGDGHITAVDALQVINYLNSQPTPTSEPVGSWRGGSGAADVLPPAAPRSSDTGQGASKQREDGRPVEPRLDQTKLVDASQPAPRAAQAASWDVVDRAIEEESLRADALAAVAHTGIQTLDLDWLGR